MCLKWQVTLKYICCCYEVVLNSIYTSATCLSSLWSELPGGPVVSMLRTCRAWVSSVDWGGWKVAQQGLGSCTLQRGGRVPTAEREHSDHSLEVSSGVHPLLPPLLFYSSITKKVGETGSDWAALDLPPCLRGVDGGGFAESLNVTLIDRYLCEPALQPVVVGSLLHSTNRDDFSVPPVKLRYVIAVLTMRQVCFRSRTLLWSSEMCRAQLQDLDDSCSVGALDGV